MIERAKYLEIVDETPNVLKLRNTRQSRVLWWFMVVLTVPLVVGASLTLVHRLTYEETLTCRPDDGGACVHVRTGLLKTERTTITASSISDVRLANESSPPALLLLRRPDNVRVPLEGEPPRRKAALRDLRSYFESANDRSLTVRRRYAADWGGPLVAMVLCFGGALFFASRLYWTRIRIDRSEGRLHLHRRRLFGFGTEEFGYDADAIEDIELESNTYRGHTGYRIIVHPESNEPLPLTAQYTKTSREECEAIRDRIESYLKLW